MAKWTVTHEDGRSTEVFAPDEAGAKKQALHQQVTDHAITMGRRDKGSSAPAAPSPSTPVKVAKIKD